VKTRVGWRAGAVLFGCWLQPVGQPRLPTAPAADARYEAALDRMLGDIADAAALPLTFVKEATAVGDLRGAIAALERMLLLNPSLGQTFSSSSVFYTCDLEIKRLAAITSKMRAAPNVPVVVREASGGTARQLRWPFEWRKALILHWASCVNLHYDNNANAAPSSPGVFGHDPFTGQDLIFELSRQSLKKIRWFPRLQRWSDAQLRAGRDRQRPRDQRIDLSSKYNDLSNLNFTVASLDVGPVLRVGGSIDAPDFATPLCYGHLRSSGQHSLPDSVWRRPRAPCAGHCADLRFSQQVEYHEAGVQERRGSLSHNRSQPATMSQPETGLVHQFGRALQVSANLSASRASAGHELPDLHSIRRRIWREVTSSRLSGNGPPWAVWPCLPRCAKATMTVPIRRSIRQSPATIRSYDAVLTLDIPVTRTILLSVRGNYTNKRFEHPELDVPRTGGSIGASWRLLAGETQNEGVYCESSNLQADCNCAGYLRVVFGSGSPAHATATSAGAALQSAHPDNATSSDRTRCSP